MKVKVQLIKQKYIYKIKSTDKSMEVKNNDMMSTTKV